MTKFVKIPLQFFVILQFVDGFTYQQAVREIDICGTSNGHRKYLELGDSGELVAENIFVPKYFQEMSKVMNISTTHHCSIELVTCPSCVIDIEIDEINFLSNCRDAKNGVCRCDHLVFGEPPYNTMEKNLQFNCGTDEPYQTKTRSLQLKFLYWNNYTTAFKLKYKSIENRQNITPMSSDDDDESMENLHNDEVLEIMSPFFPSPYPRDYITEYNLQCASPLRHVHVIFTDFQLSKLSTMDFVNTNGEKFYATGATFRPPVLISSGSSMTIRFGANGGEGVYKAKVSCITEEETLDVDFRPRTQECGGLVSTLGGFITMMDMSSSEDNPIFYDCIWLVRPSQRYDTSKTHLSIQVEKFESMADESEISIHQGLTSDKKVLEYLRSSRDSSVQSKNLVASIATGFYVRFRGKLDDKSKLAIVYTSFSYSKCYVGSEFECRNQRCIPLALQCDGFDHCGDGSDEHGLCSEMWEHGIIHRQWPVSRYYFPKTDGYPDVKTTTFALLLSSATFLFVISCLLMTMYRNGNRAREQEQFQNQLQTISQLLEANSNAANQQLEELNSEPPPIYEAPPNYDEIIQIGMDDQMIRVKKERRSGRKSRLHKPRRSDPAVSVHGALLEVVNDENSDIPSISSTGSESPFFMNQSRSDNFLSNMQMIDIEEANESPSANRSSAVTPDVTNYFEDNENDIERKMSKSCSEPVNAGSCCPLHSTQSFNSDDASNPKTKTWIRFSCDDRNLPSTSKQFESFDSVSDAEMLTIDNYFQIYEKPLLQTSHSVDSSAISTKACFCDSSQSILSDKFKTSLLSNKIECDRCKNLIYQRENRRCSLCGDCVAALYSPKICEICRGRISYQDLMNSSIKHDLTINRSNAKVIKLCNCFPKYPSQNMSSIHPNENEIQTLPKICGKSCSYNEIVHKKDKKSNQYFSSHNCLPLRSNYASSDSDDDDEYEP